MEMLLFEKIAYLEKEAKKVPKQFNEIADKSLREAAIKSWKEGKAAKKAAKKNSTFTNIDGSKVDKGRYPGTDWNNLGVRIENTPLAGHYYINPTTPEQIRHNNVLDGYYSYKPNIISRAWRAWREHGDRVADRELFEMQMQNRAARHAEAMHESYLDRRADKQLSDKRSRDTNLQGLAMLGGGGALGGGALLVSNRQQQPPYMASPMYYEQDYYH